MSGESDPANAGLHIFALKSATIAGDTIENTTDATDFPSSIFTLPHRTMQTGSRLSILARGTYSTTDVAPRLTTDLIFNVSASAVVATTGNLLQPPNVSNQGWEVAMDIMCNVPGEGGFSIVQGHRTANTGDRTSQREDMENTAGTFWDSTRQVAISLRQTWNVASGTNSTTLRQFTVGLWGPP